MHAPTTVTRNDGPSRRTARASATDAPDGLDWQTFTARYFPGSRRHNLTALTAYATYRTNSQQRLEPQSRQRTYPKRRARVQDAAALAAVAMEAWEGEGGTAQ